MDESISMSGDGGQTIERPGLPRLSLAWGVHLLTSLGAVLAVLALDAISRQSWRECFLLLGGACLIDAADGSLARWLRVKEVVPGVDGALLDNLVDFLNFAAVPAYFLLRCELLPKGTEGLAAATVMLTSCYQFSQVGAKTEDHYFLGFPSYWNIVAFYLLVSGFFPATNLRIVLGLGGLVFVPLKYIYPSRTREWQRRTLALTGLWALMVAGMIFQLPEPSPWLVKLSWVYIAYYLGASLWLNRRSSRESSAPTS
jgi:phosphatidylcholine synthase